MAPNDPQPNRPSPRDIDPVRSGIRAIRSKIRTSLEVLKPLASIGASLEAQKSRAIKLIEKDDEAVLGAFNANGNHSNTFVSNFFRYFNGIESALARNGLTRPKAILELGCGRIPYTGLRFLLEGAERFVANDILEVQGSFPAALVAELKTACRDIDPALLRHAERVFRRNGDRYDIAGLELLSAVSFDEADIAGEIGLITSVSVLEHVMQPERIARKMADVLPSGGILYHSIDFKDHRDFSRPLEFCKLTAEQYAPHATENRLRSSDWIALLESAGFEILDGLHQAMSAESVASGHDFSNCSYQFYSDRADIVPSVTEADRAGFTEPFRSKDLVDLSILCSQIVCRKI